MSDAGDPFARNSKTVLRLNPGGRRPQPAPSAPPPVPPPATPYPSQPQSPPPYSPPSGNAAPGYPQPSYAPPPYSPAPAYQPPPPPSNRPDEWFNAPPPPPPPSAEQGRALILKRDVPVASNENILLEAAGPLLLLLGRLRTSLMSANFANLMEQVADAIEEFEKRMKAASVPPEQTEMAKYAVCAMADDIVQHIPSEHRHIWAQYSMLSRFFGERVGGIKFFEILEKAKADPLRNYAVLELLYACLALGFQGVHRTSANGPATLQMLQRNLYEVLRTVKSKVSEDLSPHWQGQSLPAVGATFRIPLWTLYALAFALLFAAFITLRILLSGNTDAVTEEMQRLFPDSQLSIERAAVPVPAPPIPPKVSTQLERIRAVLVNEIEQKKADAIENGNFIVIRVGDFASFAPGQATVLDSFKPIAAKIAESLEREPGDIRIVGHTDSTKIANARFPSNFELSVERANAVAALLKTGISQKERFKVEGKGDTVPLASNQTVEGRARNRRVEISIPREETLNKP